MVIAKNLKEDIIKQLETQGLVHIPASEEDYLSLAYDLPFKVEYHENEIITMGLASYWHEKLAARFIVLLSQIFELIEGDYDILGSNTGVQIPKFEGGYYMPDVTIVKDEPVFKENSKAIITNPYIVVEVLSPATSTFDVEYKLPEYKHLESLQQIIYVSPKKVFVSTYIRSENPNIWLNQDFHSLDDAIMVEGASVLLSDIYKKIKFEK
jgi:Uma2 family endonuclease